VALWSHTAARQAERCSSRVVRAQMRRRGWR